MSDQFDVYGIGHALVDLQYTVSKDTLQALGVNKGVMTLIDQTRQAELLEALASESANSASGGSAANTAIAVSKFGGRAFYACQVGDDDWGRFYREDLERAGVGTSPDCRTPGKTGQCIVFVTPDADRTLNAFLGASSGMGPARVSEVTIKSSRFIYLEGYLLTSELGLKACRKAQEIARQSGTAISLTLSDPSIVAAFRERFEVLVSGGVDLLFCNEEEACAYTGVAVLESAVAALADLVPAACVTCGSRGAVTCEGGRRFDVPGVSVEAVDTTGAGDSFAGGVLAGLTRGHSLNQAAALGTYAGARVVSAYGPRLAQSLGDQIDRILADAGPVE